MTHAPGPWRIQPTSMDGQFIVSGGDRRAGNYFSVQLGDTNARLIAAAPDLLEALQLVVSNHRRGYVITPANIEHIEAAIAKATGAP